MQAVRNDDTPNPFALHLSGFGKPTRKQGWSNFGSALKFFLIIALLLGATLLVGNYSKKWIADHLMNGFESLSVPEKQQRLLQISELDTAGIHYLVHAIVDPNSDVAQTAYKLLSESQNQWTTLQWSKSCEHHLAMVQAMQNIVTSIQDDRTGWTTGLLQQTIMESVQEKDADSVLLYDLATSTLAKMSLSTSSGPSVLNSEPLNVNEPIRLAVKTKPLPISEADALEAWADWPLSESKVISSGGRPSTQTSVEPEPQVETPPAQPPSVYRSSATRLQPVEPNETVELKDIRETRVAATPIHVSDQELIPTSYLTESPMETYDTTSVIHWLGSEHPALREKAIHELVRRGFSERQIQLATHVASSDVGSRLALVDTIARSSLEDPRPWLAMLLNDESREVRMRTITVIGTMNDPAMSEKLRDQLMEERDPIVNAKIRSVLGLR